MIRSLTRFVCPDCFPAPADRAAYGQAQRSGEGLANHGVPRGDLAKNPIRQKMGLIGQAQCSYHGF